MLYTLRVFFPSKCSLFHNSNVFGSCIIHILYTGVLKLKKKIPEAKVKERVELYFYSPSWTVLRVSITLTLLSSSEACTFLARW